MAALHREIPVQNSKIRKHNPKQNPTRFAGGVLFRTLAAQPSKAEKRRKSFALPPHAQVSEKLLAAPAVLFFCNALEGLTALFHVYELPRFGVSFRPTARQRILDLCTITYGTFSIILACIFCHVKPLLKKRHLSLWIWEIATNRTTSTGQCSFSVRLTHRPTYYRIKLSLFCGEQCGANQPTTKSPHDDS